MRWRLPWRPAERSQHPEQEAQNEGGLRIALISPKGPLYRHNGGVFKQSLRYMPLTFPTLAALVPEELNASITCYDEGIEEVPDELDADLVGLTVLTGTAPRAYELAAQYRAQGCTVVMGGPHISLVPEEAQAHADAIVVGYAEESWPRLLRDFVAGTLQGRYDQSPDLAGSASPLPDRSVLPRRSYITRHVFEATRACKHGCEFCVAPSAWGRKQLQKPVEDIVADMRRMGTRRAIFVDLNLISDRDYAWELFAALKPLNIQWFGLATTRLCDDIPLLDLAAESGCRGLLMGLESIEPDSLREMRKGFNRPDDYQHVVKTLHERRIALQGCFVFGLDHDTPTTCDRTAEMAVDIGIDLPRFAIATPFPGTPFFKRMEQQGRIIDYDWEHYDGQHVVFQPEQMTPDELKNGLVRAWQHAYSWRSIGRRLRRTAASWPVAALTNLGYRHYGFNLDRFYTCDVGVGYAGGLG